MKMGLTSSQELVEVQLNHRVTASFQEKILEVLATKPEHRIVALSTVATGEFPLYMRALIVIEYIARAD